MDDEVGIPDFLEGGGKSPLQLRGHVMDNAHRVSENTGRCASYSQFTAHRIKGGKELVFSHFSAICKRV